MCLRLGDEMSLYLTKSRYMSGLQCPRRLWRSVHQPVEYCEASAGSTADIGQEVGTKAHLLFPGGVLLDAKPWEHAKAVKQTAALMDDPSVPAIFEAAFEYENVRIRVDVLERLPKGKWGLREVKSSGKAKPYYFDDIALQTYVLKGAGIKLASIELLHINTKYKRGKSGINWSKFFTRLDVATEIKAILREINGQLAQQMTCLRKRKEPVCEVGAHCHNPVSCDFYEHCTADKPDDWVQYLPKISAKRLGQLAEMDIKSIAHIPADFPLTAQQQMVRQATISGKKIVASDLRQKLDGFGPPAVYLDFEAMNPAIPLFPGNRPFQIIPFQWSLHQLQPDGTLAHQEFLANGDEDPRHQFVTSLIKALGRSKTPIIVYSAYEKARLKELAVLFPEQAPKIEAIIARLRDLLTVTRRSVYHPDFHYSWSIKTVAPALCPRLSYDDLDQVANGMEAANAFIQLVQMDAQKQLDTVHRLRRALLAYCQQDTLAMVEVHRALI